MSRSTSEVKHTPGPWNIRESSDKVFPRFRIEGTTVKMGCKCSEPVATTRTNGDHLHEKANALLIAAAPELLDLLRAALEFIEPVYVNNSQSVDWRAVLQEQAERWMFDSKAAIAKAEGRQ